MMDYVFKDENDVEVKIVSENAVTASDADICRMKKYTEMVNAQKAEKEEAHD